VVQTWPPSVGFERELARMIPIHAHLLLNHVPIVGLMVGLVFLLVGVTRSSEATFLAGVRILVVIGVIAVPVVVSGLLSASALEGVRWLDAGAVRQHRLAGILTLGLLLPLATASALILFDWSDDGRAVAPWVKKAIVALAVVALAMGLWTCDRGGTIRHSELHEPAQIDRP
jgi:hypothetical protein